MLLSQIANKKYDCVRGKCYKIRVTRLGEFSPIGQLFSLGSFLKIPEVAHIFE
jgi:hypothetical protein